MAEAKKGESGVSKYSEAIYIAGSVLRFDLNHVKGGVLSK